MRKQRGSMRLWLALVALGLVGVLAACGSEDPTPTSAPTATPTPIPAPTATPTPAAAGRHSAPHADSGAANANHGSCPSRPNGTS